MGTFALTIELGNDAMQTPEDVEEALRRCVLHRLATGYRQGKVTDLNGNTVGSYNFSNEE